MQAARIVRRLSSAGIGALVAGTLAVAPGTAVLASGQDITVASSAGSANLAALAGLGQAVGSDPATEISPATFIENGSAQATKPAAGAPTVAPDPAGSPIGTSTSARGFDGLDHRDQRLAGTGKYVGTQFSLEPPDQALCVGNGFVVESVNTAVEVFDTGGHSLAGPAAINQLFGLAPEVVRSAHPVFGDFTSDPTCLFDKATNRFFLTVLQIDTNPANGHFGNHSGVLIAVTQTGDPTGTWNFFKIDTTGTGHTNCPCFGDQPLIGFDKTGFFISTNEFPIHVPGFNGAQLYAMSKSKLAHGISPSVVHFDTGAIGTPDVGGIWYSLQPAVPATTARGDSRSNEGEGGGGGTQYFVGALDFNSTLDNRVVVFNMTNTQSLNQATPSLGLTHRVIRSETYGQPPVATQKAGLPRPLGIALGEPLAFLNSNDDRMNQVAFADGRLWTGVNTTIGSGASARVGIAWFAIDPNGEDGGAKVEDQGYVVAPGSENVMFPSIAVGDSGPVMVFTISGPNHFPSAAIKRLRDDSSIEIVGAGTGPADGFSGYVFFTGGNVERWGDYSAATTAPDGSIWMATEYIGPRPRTVNANWGTFIVHVTGEHDGHEGN